MQSIISIIKAAVFACICGFLSASSPAEVVIYPAPEGTPHNDDFSVKVRESGGKWQELFEYAVQVDMHKPRTSSMAYFDFSGPVEVSVTYNRGAIQSARIRPLSYGIVPEVRDDVLTFKLTEPRNLSVEINGDIFRNLQVFAGPIEANRPSKDDPNVIYFGPGVHELPGGTLQVTSNKTVYIAGGAVVQGRLLCNNAENMRILGRGILSKGSPGDRIGGIRIDDSKNVLIDGIIVFPPGGSVFVAQSADVRIANLKSISSGKWSDGIDVYCSRNIMIEGVFMRNSDDCIALYDHRWKLFGDTRNVTVRNSTLWADVAHPIHIGTHGNPQKPEVIEDAVFSNIDILNHDEPQIGYQGCMSINVSDENLVRNIRFENIRVEDFEQGQLVNLRVTFNKKYCTAPGRGIENIYFKDITYNGSRADISVISGYNESRSIKNVVFENLVINGKVVMTADAGRFHVGEHVEGLLFQK